MLRDGQKLDKQKGQQRKKHGVPYRNSFSSTRKHSIENESDKGCEWEYDYPKSVYMGQFNDPWDIREEQNNFIAK